MGQLYKFFKLKAAGVAGDAGNIQQEIQHPATSMPGAMTTDLKRLGYGVDLAKLNDPDNIVALRRIPKGLKAIPADPATGFPGYTPPTDLIDLYFDDAGYVKPKGHLGKYIGGIGGATAGAAGAAYINSLLRKLETKEFRNNPSFLRTLKKLGLLSLPIAGGIVGAKLGGNFDTPSGNKFTYTPVYAPGTGATPTTSTKIQRFIRNLW